MIEAYSASQFATCRRISAANGDDPGEAFLDVNAAGGTLWVTWVVDQNTLQYAVWDAAAEEWSEPSSVPISGGNVAAAKAAARAAILS